MYIYGIPHHFVSVSGKGAHDVGFEYGGSKWGANACVVCPKITIPLWQRRRAWSEPAYEKLVGLDGDWRSNLLLDRVLLHRPQSRALCRLWDRLQVKCTRRRAVGFVRSYCRLHRIRFERRRRNRSEYRIFYLDRPALSNGDRVAVFGTSLRGTVQWESGRTDMYWVKFGDGALEVHRCMLHVC